MVSPFALRLGLAAQDERLMLSPFALGLGLAALRTNG